MKRTELPSRFWEKVEKNNNGCWNWTGHKNSQGYGTFRFNGIMCRASRVIMNAPKDSVVRHTCDNTSCVNPEHLIIGTQKDNILDCISRNRRSSYIGKDNNFSKLNESQIKELRNCFDSISTSPSGRKAYGEVQKLAERFGITDSNLYYIVNRKTWNHI